MHFKCEAKLLGISAIELKKRKEAEQKASESEVIAQESSILPMMGVFGMFTGAGFLLSYALMKMKN